jgi:phage shock protein PspC (stress-responsive transcriptional regulator)
MPMECRQCQRTIDEDSAYCRFCGSRQQVAGAAGPPRRLGRSPENGRIAGVCAGIAEYLDVDVTFVRVVWTVLSIVPGAIIGGVIAYIAAWLVMPERSGPLTPSSRRRVQRSILDRKIAGVCGGIAEYFNVDPTPVRLLAIVLTVLPGAIVCGVIAYIVAWAIIPSAGDRITTFESAPSAS